MPPKTYSERDLEIGERLATVEARLENVQGDLQDLSSDLLKHQTESKDRTEELKGMIVALGVKIDDSKFKWSSIVTPENLKIIAYAILSLASATAAAKALLP